MSDTARVERFRTPPAKVNSQRLQQRQISAARMFTPLFATHGLSTFTSLFVPTYLLVKSRKHLRQISLLNSSILYIHYPKRLFMALLVRNEFADQIKQTLNIFRVAPIPDFDSLDPVHLNNTKYDDLSEDERAQKGIRAPLLQNAQSYRKPLLSKEMKNLLNKNSAHANNLFHRSGSNHSMSFDGASTSVSTMSAIGHDFE
ncbi:hypothetical protein EC973_006938 [Apophysomyces ossiformis]|uniref:Uncharacterized protein n=1 Tax=Apophysomyces ossiformis TaxID=679940 RepID=A0A8H7BUF6_9FUNG|nr:hypothetical protein EC973_006938 [Apophysomyces ossiformis]